MKFLATHIADQKLSFDIFTIGLIVGIQHIFMEHNIYLLS